MDTANWIRCTARMVFSSPVRMRGITSAMQSPIFPFPAREHRYLGNRPYSHPGEPTNGGVVVSTIMSSARQAS